MKFIHLVLCLSLFVYCVWGAPPQPISVSDTNILQQLPGIQKSISATPRAKAKQRPGPKPKALENRVYKVRGPIRRVERSYSREKKIEVLIFLMHRLPKGGGEDDGIEYRCPTQTEASQWFRIPQRTISEWLRNRVQIVGQKIGSRRQRLCLWPQLEIALFERFVKEHEAGRPVRRGWFRRQAKQLFSELYPNAPRIFVFSHVWFTNFQRRWSISSQSITRKASKVPEEYHQLIQEWLRFNRRNSQPRNSLERDQIVTDIGRYSLSNILNLAEVPIPFEYLDGRTLDFIRNKSISNGWDKRQATLILYLFADGVSRIKPKLIFHGSSGPSESWESNRYHGGVTVEFNKTAYSNKKLFLQFIEKELIPALNPRKSESTSSLLVLDDVLARLRCKNHAFSNSRWLYRPNSTTRHHCK